jgi:hypothetical protein
MSRSSEANARSKGKKGDLWDWMKLKFLRLLLSRLTRN